jgi:hypothetical protein
MKILKLLFFHDVKITVIGSIAQSRQSAKLFLKSSELGLPHPPTRLRERGGRESQLRRGNIHCDTQYCIVFTLCSIECKATVPTITACQFCSCYF